MATASPYDHTSPGIEDPPVVDGKGEQQEKRCRDPLFAFLLYGNLAAIVTVVGIYGTAAFSQLLDDTADAVEGASGSSTSYDYSGYVRATFILGAVAIVLTGATLPIMLCIPGVLIKCSLLLMLVLSGAMVVLSFISGNFVGGIVGLIFFLMFGCYARTAWSRIPFASANLITACTAIRKNCGVLFIALFFVVLAFGWTLLWSIAAMGVWDQVIDTDVAVNQQPPTNYGYLFLLLLSYFFTEQVIQNTTHVTVAGTVGSWWFSPGEGGVCGSVCRAMTTSFGSICMGSLAVAIVQALRSLAQYARQQEGGIFVCIAECILGCIESIMEYFNQWAFVYVGLYGYSYLEAGKNVITLFKNRGWSSIIADDLIGNVFFFLSLCVGLICSGIGYYSFAEDSPEGWFEDSPAPETTSAICAGLGFIAGLVLSSILMSTISSAVNTVIVCFAEAPAEFEANHPELSSMMREAWLDMYPDCGV